MTQTAIRPLLSSDVTARRRTQPGHRHGARATEWVDAAPFRAWLRQLMSDTGLPWRVLARAARVQPGVVHGLLHHGGSHRIRYRDAENLLAITSATFEAMAKEPARCETVRLLTWALGLRGASVAEIAGFLGTDTASMRLLMAGGPVWCSRLTQLRGEAACQAWGADPDELLTQ